MPVRVIKKEAVLVFTFEIIYFYSCFRLNVAAAKLSGFSSRNRIMVMKLASF